MRDIIILGKPTMRQIAASVAEAHGLGPKDIYTQRREKWVTHPRQEAMARMHWAGFSHAQIVRHFGFKNHTTSVHAKRAVEERGLDYRVPQTKWVAWIKAEAQRALAQQEVA